MSPFLRCLSAFFAFLPVAPLPRAQCPLVADINAAVQSVNSSEPTGDTLGQEVFEVALPGAMVERLGRGCGPHFAQLDADAPLIGQTMTLSGTLAPSPFGAVALGVPASTPVVMPLSLGCATWIDLGGFFLLTNLSTPPSWTLPVALPNDPGMVGTSLTSQAVYFVPATVSIAGSNGVRLTFGS